MKNDIYDDIIKYYGYNALDRELDSYIDDYMISINNYLKDNRLDIEQLKRYMLIGLWIDYRAGNHNGSGMSTSIEMIKRNQRMNPKRKEQRIYRFNLFNDLFGEQIESISDYLEKVSPLTIFNITSQAMYDFVVKGPGSVIVDNSE